MQETMDQYLLDRERAAIALKDFETWDLVLELERREGVSTCKVGPAHEVEMTISSPAVVLTVDH